MDYIDSKEARLIENALQFAQLQTKPYWPFPLTQDYLTVRRLAKRLTTIDIHSCNGTKYTTDESYDRAVITVYEELEIMFPGDQDIHWYHQRDPRGASLYLSREPLNAENYNRGVAVFSV